MKSGNCNLQMSNLHRNLQKQIWSIKRHDIKHRKKLQIFLKKGSKNVVNKVKTGVFIDGCCILTKHITIDNMNDIRCIGLFVSCIFNNILFKRILSDNNFINRSIELFVCGLISNSFGAIIYIQPFKFIMYMKYVLLLSLGMSIFSNIRYTLIYKLEKNINLTFTQSLIIRILNNIVGIIQQTLIITYYII